MMTSPIPQNYEEWRHCITVECGIPLTAGFITERLAIWRDENSEESRRFSKLYGDQYRLAVIGWFEQAEQELA